MTAAAFQMLVGQPDPPSPTEFAVFESWEVCIEAGRLLEQFGALASSHDYFAGSRTSRRPRYNCEDFAKDIVGAFVARDHLDDDFM